MLFSEIMDNDFLWTYAKNVTSKIGYNQLLDHIKKHFKYYEINYELDRFCDLFINRMDNVVNYVNYIVDRTFDLEYDVLNYNTSVNQIDNTNLFRTGSDNPNDNNDLEMNFNYDNKSLNKQTTTYKHQSELKSSQAFIQEERDLYLYIYD